MRLALLRQILSYLLVIIVTSGEVLSQEQLSIQEVEERIAQAEGEEASGEVVNQWKAALELQNKLSISEKNTENLKVELKELEKKASHLDSIKFIAKGDLPGKDLSLSEVATRVEELTIATSDALLQSTKLNKLEVSRVSRSALIPGLIREAKASLEVLQSLESGDSSDAALVLAKQQVNLANKGYLQQYVLELGVEQMVINVGAPVLKLESRVAEENVVHLRGLLDEWKKRLNLLEAKDTATEKEKITQQIEDFEQVPELRQIALDNLALLEQLEKMRSANMLDRSQRYLDKIDADLYVLKTNQEYAVERIKHLDSAGISVDRETGRLLQEQASELLSESELSTKIKEVYEVYTNRQLSLLKLKNSRRTLPANTEEFLNALKKRNKLELVSADEARQVISEHSDLLDQLIEVMGKIGSNEKAQIASLEKMKSLTENYSKFISERLIFIANADSLSLKDVHLEFRGLYQIVREGYVMRWLEKMKSDFFSNMMLWLLVAFILLFIVVKSKEYRKLAAKHHQQARRRNCQSFTPTFKGMLLDALTVSPLPISCAFLKWRSSGMWMFEQALAVAGMFIILAGLVYRYSRHEGFIVSNFKLNSDQVGLIHRTMRWFIPTMLVSLTLFLILTELNHAEPYGRIFFILSVIVTMLALMQLFRPKNQLLNQNSMECMISKTVFVICLLMTLSLIVSAWLGYYSSAINLRNQFIISIWIIIISVFIAALLNRWFLVSSRKIAIKQALKRREVLIAERELKAADGSESKIVTRSAEEVEAEAVNVAGVKEQTRKLVRVGMICSIVFGLWGVFSESLPALSILDRQELWERASDSSEESLLTSNPISNIVTDSTSENVPSEELDVIGEVVDDSKVSLQDLLFSFILFILTYVAAKNIPGLLEITILDNLNIKSGAAFALTTTVRYLIVLSGVIWAFGNIGLTWSSIQWIAAAVTLGIGFGLQEVFANFVAGLILLYERPIRLGDVVTVGTVSGRVSKIQIRATTVRQFNNHELIVPNKEFITGQLVNWTLSDNIIRAEVTVGVAYGTDTSQVEELLMKVADAHPKVLKTPEPDVLFLAFGESSLDFKLRTFVAGYDDLVETQSDLHYEVNAAFEKAGIVIPFPQRDLNIQPVSEAIPVTQLGQVFNSNE